MEEEARPSDRRWHGFYTIPEAARALQVSPSTVWRWVQARGLRAYRVGPRRFRIRPEDLKRVVQPLDRERGEPEAGRAEAWRGYDPEQAREALRASAGALAGVDVEELTAELRAQREQASEGRPGGANGSQ